ncbi:MAG: AI-2E family transporter [Oceanicola sp.]|jgi:predicted PurR-regulated permease PerM|nr:AI-2E family transporter [Oceanicola sp.]
MALPSHTQVRYWAASAAVFLLLLWFLGDVITPFLLGGAIAYCLDPLADRLENRGLSRVAAVTIISVLAVLVFLAMVLLVIPMLIDQSTSFVLNIPELIASLQAFLMEQFPEIMEADSTINQSLASLGETIRSKGGALLSAIITSFQGVVNIILLVLFVPVVTFYLLLDWDHMIARIDDLLPRDHAPAIRRIASDIDKTLAGFIRGQGTVCLILGTFYAVALMAVGLQFGLFVGALAGLISFIPFVGSIVGGVLSIGLALFQFWGEWFWIGLVALIFIGGQAVEGNVLTPKLVGGSVGLHPVWLIFSLSAFGSVFGFVGLLVAVPVSASIGVLTRFLIAEYKGGRLYRGLTENDDDTP